jgi:hypothetical protein
VVNLAGFRGIWLSGGGAAEKSNERAIAGVVCGYDFIFFGGDNLQCIKLFYEYEESNGIFQ